MSHFIGLVFLRPDADLDETLAPYCEQDENYMEFVDKTDEVKAEYDKLPEVCPTEGTFTQEEDMTDTVNKIWDEAADTLSPEDEKEFWKPYTKDEFPTPTAIAEDKGYAVEPDETKRDGVRFVRRWEAKWEYQASKEKYPTLDKFAKEYYGYNKREGRYGYMSNPDAKWDWYSVGGRWDGFLINKEGKETNEDYLTEIDWEKTSTPRCFVDTDGVWHEKGEMGWFGMSYGDKKQADWDAEFNAYVQSLLADAEAKEIEVVAVDYHI